jgi:hypothetical protein
MARRLLTHPAMARNDRIGIVGGLALLLCAIIFAACVGEGLSAGEPGGYAPAVSADSVHYVTGSDLGGAYVDWTNAQATWRIYTGCAGVIYPPGHPNGVSVGPGYIAKVTLNNGQTITDDTTVDTWRGLNSGATGLGQFGFHLARGPKYGGSQTTTCSCTDPICCTNHVWQITTRWCNANRQPDSYGTYRGWGVGDPAALGPTFGVSDGPRIDANGVGHLTIWSMLADQYSALERVQWTYEFHGGAVRVWMRFSNLCSDGDCGNAPANGYAFVKEPKINLGVNPDPTIVDAINFTEMVMGRLDGSEAQNTTDNSWSNSCGSAQHPFYYCEWGGQDPANSTGQCDDARRGRVDFRSGENAPANDLIVVAKGARGEYDLGSPWEGGGHGLDQWAVNAGRRTPLNTYDSGYGGAISANNCHNTPADQHNRRWEMGGYALTPQCSYTTAAVGLHGWEGGSGIDDCEPLYRRFGANEPDYVNYVEYGIGSAH